MAAVQRTGQVDWTGTIVRGAGQASGVSGALAKLPITVLEQAAREAEGRYPVSRPLQGNVAIAVHATLEGLSASSGIGAHEGAIRGSMMNQRLRLEGMHAATASTTGWIENRAGHGSPCLFCGNPAGAFKPLDQGWAHFVQRLWWCRACEATWVD